MSDDDRIKELEAACAEMRLALVSYDPPMPPALEGETAEEYTDRVTGADGTGRVPYAERRNRQCSIGYHEECSDRDVAGNERVCHCPCHQFEGLRERALASDAGKGLLAELEQAKAEIAQLRGQLELHHKGVTWQENIELKAEIALLEGVKQENARLKKELSQLKEGHVAR